MPQVPRETAPPGAGAIFTDRLGLAERFVEHLCTTGVERGLIGPRELPRIWSRHVLNCAVLQELLPERSEVIDVGSGAGLPGLALAIARPDLAVTLVEPLERRTVWLTEVIADLGLDVRVVRARGEELAGALAAEYVTARAVAPLERLADWGLPLVSPGGQLLAIKGRTAGDEVEGSRDYLLRVGAVAVDVVTCGDRVLDPATTVVRVRVGPDGYLAQRVGARQRPSPRSGTARRGRRRRA